MLDATPAADVSARPQLPPGPAAIAGAPQTRSCAGALIAAARTLLPVLEAGRPLDAATLRDAMTRAFGASDAQGAWVWKDAYEAAEAAAVLFLQRYARAMRNRAGAGADGPRKMLAMLAAIAALEPSHTKRSEQQIRLQQFSTPLPLAYAALKAAAIRPGDTVLEPSAGTGMLAVMAQCALASRAAGHLHLNEIADVRAGLLAALFPEADVTRHNAEAIADFLPELRPCVVLMNPPFSATPGVERIRHDADLRHLRSAFSMLPPGGRLAAITSSHCVPGDAAWRDAFAFLDGTVRVVFTMAIDGRAYARRGTGFDTRLTVLDRSAEPGIAVDRDARAPDAAALLDAVIADVPPRLAIEPVPGADLFGHRPAPRAATPRTARKPAAQPAPKPAHDWGPVAELAVETGRADFDQPGRRQPLPPPDPTRHGARAWCGFRARSSIRRRSCNPAPWPRCLTRCRPTARCCPHAWSPTGCCPTPSSRASCSRARPMRATSPPTTASARDGRPSSAATTPEPVRGRLSARPSIPTPSPATARCCPPRSASGAAGCWATAPAPARAARSPPSCSTTGCAAGAVRCGSRSPTSSSRTPAATGPRSAGATTTSSPWASSARGPRSPCTRGSSSRPTRRCARRPGKGSRRASTRSSPGSQARSTRTTATAYQGCILFDEAHAMANAAGSKGNRGEVAPSQQGRAGLRLQHALPDARIAYVSATGATTVPGLAYAGRLGLWAAGETPFETRTEFVSAMEAGGVAALEVVARDLKALGLYQARALSYDGVEVEILEHPLTDAQRRIYDAYAGAFKVIHHNIEEALKATGIMEGDSTLNKNAKSAAMSAFEGAKQRFFGHLLTSMKCPSLIRAIEADLDAGRSAVVQLVSTGEALMERRIAEIPASEWDDINVDLTPRETVIEFLVHAFPVQLQEPFTDDEGNVMLRPVFDDDGNPVICQEAAARRDALIEKLASLPPVPAALDQIVQHFGHEAVAEVTGRSRRVLKVTDARGERLALRSRPASANLAETAAFMDRTKRILVFSMAGGTGRSYHADLSSANTERRIHYLLEPGWRADQAIQGLGRTHRTHQASAPLFRPVATDVKGERRFIATIARRLDSLGAITRGQRDSQTAMGGDDQALFRESDNLESLYAKAALRQFYGALWLGRIPGWSVDRFEKATGLKLAHEGSLKEELPPMPRFLNRLLALPIDEQNELFAELEERIAANIEQAVEAGTYHAGVETVLADSLSIAGRETIYEHPGTGAATELAEILRRDRLVPTTAEAGLGLGERDPGPDGKPVLMVNARSKRAAVALPAPSRMFDDGGVQERVRLVRPAVRESMARAELDASNWRRADEVRWRMLWEQEIASLPTHRDSRFWLAAGLLLPIWDRLPAENMRVRRLTTDAGEALIGRVLDAEQVRAVRTSFGLDGGFAMTGAEAFEAVMGRGSALALANGWRLARRRIMGADRVEIEGPADGDTDALKRMGCTVEIVSWRARAFAPGAKALERILERWPLAA